MQRRNLLRGLLGLAVVPILPAVAPAAPAVISLKQLMVFGGDFDGDVMCLDSEFNKPQVLDNRRFRHMTEQEWDNTHNNPHRIFKRQVGLGWEDNDLPIWYDVSPSGRCAQSYAAP